MFWFGVFSILGLATGGKVFMAFTVCFLIGVPIMSTFFVIEEHLEDTKKKKIMKEEAEAMDNITNPCKMPTMSQWEELNK